MSPLVLAAVVSAGSFLATNLENLFILLAYAHHPRYPMRAIAIGYVGAIGLILLASHALSQPAQAMPAPSIHYLGLLPVALGVWELLKQLFRSEASHAEIGIPPREQRTLYRAIAVGATTLTSGSDSLIVFATLFADTHYSADFAILGAGVAMAFLWIALVQWLA